MSTSTALHELVALEDDDHIWELDGGRLRRKPDMTQEHNNFARELALTLGDQLDRSLYTVGQNSGHLTASPGHSFVPDVFILPRSYIRPARPAPGGLEAFAEPMPFVCEIWSPSTGDYDTDTKIPWYQARGDAEIWRVHPYERTVKAWRRHPDGTYSETQLSGEVALWQFPEIRIDLAQLYLS